MTEIAKTQLLQRTGERVFWERRLPNQLILPWEDALGRVAADRSVADGTVEALDGNKILFKTLKTSGSQIIGTHRQEYDEQNPNQDIEWNSMIDFVQPFDSCAFPTNGALGDFSGQEYVVKYVNKLEWPGDSDYFRDEIKLYDARGGEITPPAALVGLDVSFSNKTRIHPDDYDLFFLAQEDDEPLGTVQGEEVLIPRPTGNPVTDEYALDLVAGIITLTDVWVANREDSPVYCFLLKLTRFDRVNEIHAADMVEMRTLLEGLVKASYGLNLTAQNMNAERYIRNHYQIGINGLYEAPPNGLFHDSANDWWQLDRPLVTGTNARSDYGFSLITDATPNPAGFKLTIAARIPILTFEDKRFESVPADWTLVSAKIRYKATILLNNRVWETTPIEEPPSGNQYFETGTFDPDFGMGVLSRPDPNDNWCANLLWNEDDPDAEPRCVLRDNIGCVWNVSDSLFGARFSSKITNGPIESQDGAPPFTRRNDLTAGTDGLRHGCFYGPPHRSTSSVVAAYSAFIPGGLQIYDPGGPGPLQFMIIPTTNTPATPGAGEWYRDETFLNDGSNILPKLANDGSLTCQFLAFGPVMKQFFEFTTPRNGSAASGVGATGNWEEADVTEAAQAAHADKNSTPGDLGLVIGPRALLDWNANGIADTDVFLTDIVTYSSPILGGATNFTNRRFRNDSKDYDFTLEVGELLVEWQTPAGFKAPLATDRHLPALTK